MTKPVIIIGAGGHAKVVADALLSGGRRVVGFTDARPDSCGTQVLGLPVLGDDRILTGYEIDSIELAVGIGTTGVSPERRQVFERLKGAGFCFATVVHPSATVGRDVTFAEGCQIMAGVVIQAGSRLGANVLVNTRATVDHDCGVGDHTHIGPGALLCGGVIVGRDSHIGSGATIIHGVRIGTCVQVGAGAAVVNSFADGCTVVGVPARELKR